MASPFPCSPSDRKPGNHAASDNALHGRVSSSHGGYYSIPEADWQFASALTGIATGADTTLRSAVASNRQYLTALQLQNLGSVATEFQIKDGATVIWRVSLPAAMASPIAYDFPTPLRATTNTALNCQAVTVSSAVVVNAQGYQAP